DFSLVAGDTVALVGPSGSGKTTLLGLAAGLDSPTSGEVTLDGTTLSSLSQDSISALRARSCGFIFQNFQLIPTLTAFENVLVPAELLGKEAREHALELLERVGLSQRGGHYPHQLSGGEQQRIALARAFINKPKLLFADEPTGNLDEENAEKVERLLFKLNTESDTAMLIATHNLALAERCERVYAVKHKQLTLTKPTAKEQS
ncbi:UNVERIFIED_CONTAM: hypothetical protein GTU68_034464, partial [Idotea baltica]|nr:hypothetical protein [Idotea baltica]